MFENLFFQAEEGSQVLLGLKNQSPERISSIQIYKKIQCKEFRTQKKERI